MSSPSIATRKAALAGAILSKYSRPWNIDQTLLLPPNVQDFVPKGHVSRFIVELVR